MKTFEYEDYVYHSSGSLGNCDQCRSKGYFYDEDGTYLCEDCLQENHEQGKYDDYSE